MKKARRTKLAERRYLLWPLHDHRNLHFGGSSMSWCIFSHYVISLGFSFSRQESSLVLMFSVSARDISSSPISRSDSCIPSIRHVYITNMLKIRALILIQTFNLNIYLLYLQPNGLEVQVKPSHQTRLKQEHSTQLGFYFLSTDVYFLSYCPLQVCCLKTFQSTNFGAPLTLFAVLSSRLHWEKYKALIIHA